jgi:hypothetical protein
MDFSSSLRLSQRLGVSAVKFEPDATAEAQRRREKPLRSDLPLNHGVFLRSAFCGGT